MSETKALAEAKDSKAPAPTIQKQPEIPEKIAGPSPTAPTTASALPPPNGTPPAARAGSILASSESGLGTPARARMSKAMQRSVGNARMGEKVGASVQMKLTVNTPGDVYEQEAEDVAEKVTQPGQAHSKDVAIPPLRADRERSGAGPKLQKKETDEVGNESDTGLESRIQSSGDGRPLPESMRHPMESGLGVDFSIVRVHDNTTNKQDADRLNAKAFTHGSDIWIGSAGSANDPKLMAHELTHVVQQSLRGEDRMLQRQEDDGSFTDRLEQLSDQYYSDADAWEQEGDHFQAAYAFRVGLLLQYTPPSNFADEAAFNAFVADSEETALDEILTLGRLGVGKLFFSKAFPLIWSHRVFGALYIDIDLAALQESMNEQREAAEGIAARIPDGLFDLGLPVPFDEALELNHFVILLRHIDLPNNHVVKDYAVAMRLWMIAAWPFAFYSAWNGMAESYSERVASGEYVVNPFDYEEFMATRRQGIEALAERLAAIRSEQALSDFDDEMVALQNVAFIQAFVGTLVGVIGVVLTWAQAQQLFEEKLAETDSRIQALSPEDRIYRAFIWAWENGYFGAAAMQLVAEILANGPMIITLAIFAVLVQFIPYLNIAVNLALLLYAGYDAISALFSLRTLFSLVGAADTTVGLQRASAQMAQGLEVDLLRLLLDILAIIGGTAGIRSAARRLRAQNPALSEEAALHQALREAGSRRRIGEVFDPHNLLGPLFERGANPEIVEQALMSGMSPQRLLAIAGEVGPISRVEALIRYAGEYSSPINRLLDAGLNTEIVGQLLDASFGLRELAVFERLIGRGMPSADALLVGRLYGLRGLQISESALQRGQSPDVARSIARRAGEAGELDAVQAIMDSPGFRNPEDLPEFLNRIIRGEHGSREPLRDAAQRLRQGHEVELDAGRGDVVDYTVREAVQHKQVSGRSHVALFDNLKDAALQLRGETGEIPPTGFTKIGKVSIVNPQNPFFNADRPTLADVLSRTPDLHGVDRFVISNDNGTFIFDAPF
jgi:hypothetical protein